MIRINEREIGGRGGGKNRTKKRIYYLESPAGSFGILLGETV
jgi:hypothetical protein